MKSFLLGTGNDGFRYKYEFKKNKAFKKLFLDFMKELGFGKDRELFYFNNTYEQDKDGLDILVERDITKSKDSVENYKNNKFDIDLIFFDKIMVVIIRTKNKVGLIKAVGKYFKFIGE